MNPAETDELRRAQEALAASEARFLRVMKGGNDGWWDWDLLADRIYHSPRWWSMLGYVPDELPPNASLWRRLMHADDLPAVELVLTSALANGPDVFEVEFRLRHKDGHWVPQLSRGCIERDATGRAVRMSGANTDLTARKEAEQAQRESELSQRLLLERMADGVFVAQDHRFVFANPALPALLGRAVDEVVGAGFDAIVHPDHLATWAARFRQRVGAGPEPVSQYEVAMVHRDGRPVWVELRASRIEYHGRPAVLGIVRDIGERRRADEALRAARRLAQDTLDGLTAHICVLDATGRLLSVNEAWRSFGAHGGGEPSRIGVGADYLRVCDASAAAGDADARGFAAGLRDVLERRRDAFDHRYLCRTPEGPRWFLARVTRSRGEGAVAVIVAHEDITAQVEAEQRIANLHERLSMAIQGAGYGVWEYELGSGRLLWDEQMLRLYGHTPESFDGRSDTWRACLYPDDRAAVDERFAQLMAGARVDHFEFRAVRASDGALRHIEANGYLQRDGEGRPQRLVGMNRDITAQRDAEAALRESEQRWQFAIEGAGEGVWDWHVAEQRVVYSRRWKTMLGHADEEIGSGFDEWRSRVHAEDLPAALEALTAYFEGRASSYSVEMRMRCRDGTWKWILARGLVVARDAEGRPLRMVGTHTDLTDRKTAEAERERLEGEVRQAQKMEALGTLAGGVAHDFNNVLAGILGNVSLARQDLGAGHPVQRNLDLIQRAALLARSRVQQILAFSRRRAQMLTVQDLGPIVQESVQLLRATLPAVARLECRAAPQPLPVLCDAMHLQQVLMNLCTNAWQALRGSSGRIEVGVAEARFEPGGPRPAGASTGPHAHVWVSDDGCGMDAAALARIFEPFYTTKPVDQGTGLGLSVVHGIVTAHGGAIEVESEPGRGSTFHLYFPLVAAAEDGQPAEAGDSAAAPLGQGEHVLYVDDDELMVLTVRMLLERGGWRVTTHGDGAAALAAVRATPRAFDLVVTDYNMPGCTGLELARDLLALRPDLPVVISSGFISDELRGRARELGVRGLLHKENTVEELASLVRRLAQRTPG